MKCNVCNGKNLNKIDTYKHYWYLCNDCGCAFSKSKNHYPLGFIKHPVFTHRKNVSKDYSEMYNYFISDHHIQYSIDEAKPFIEEILNSYHLEVQGKKILDISGGNGHFINEIKKLGAEVELTEINKPAADYAQNQLGIKTYLYDFNNDSLKDVVTGSKYDFIFLRAAIMFCLDLDKLIQQLKEILNENGVIIYTRCVLPTIGTLVRTQYDDYNYFKLYQPDAFMKKHENTGFELLGWNLETDQEMYVNDHDKYKSLKWIDTLYLNKAVSKLPFESKYSFRARDRKRANFIYRLNRK